MLNFVGSVEDVVEYGHQVLVVKVLVHHLHHHCIVEGTDTPAEESKAMILKAVEKGFQTVDEIKSKVLEAIEKLKERIEKEAASDGGQ